MILTRSEARAVRMAILCLNRLEESFVSITLGDSVTVECEAGIITVKNQNVVELFEDLNGFTQKYGV